MHRCDLSALNGSMGVSCQVDRPPICQPVAGITASSFDANFVARIAAGRSGSDGISTAFALMRVRMTRSRVHKSADRISKRPSLPPPSVRLASFVARADPIFSDRLSRRDYALFSHGATRINIIRNIREKYDRAQLHELRLNKFQLNPRVIISDENRVSLS